MRACRLFWTSVLLIATNWMSPAWAGPPMATTVFGQPISFDECKSRVSEALRSQGYGNWRDFGNGWIGSTANRSASVACVHGAGETVVVVVVSGEDTTEQRDRLVAQIRGRTVAAGCGWRDAMDPNAPANDPGRGIGNWRAHHDHVASGPGRADVHAVIGARLRTLRGCLPLEAYARAYADASVLIAEAGRGGAGWIDGMDGRGGADPGRGVRNWQAHFEHVASGRGVDSVHDIVAARLENLRNVLPLAVYARLYADVSVLLARYGATGR